MMIRKKILLVVPTDYTLYSLIKKNLEHIGFDVTLIVDHIGKFKYSGLLERLRDYIGRSYFNDHHFKRRLLMRFNSERQLADIRNFSHHDYGLVLRADFFEMQVLKEARNHVDRFVSFHYDGLADSKGILKRIPLFDAFYVFDKNDQEAYAELGLKHETNFYFDYPETSNPTDGDRLGFYYLSSFHKSRNDQLIAFHRYAKMLFADDVVFEVVVSRKDKNRIPRYIKENMVIHRKHIPFDEHLERIKSYRTILDFCISSHRGYSFRVFEALKYQKKLITNNTEIRNADFYHPQNIYILDQGLEGITDFLKTPYVALSKKIVSKYGFSNWIERLFSF